MSDPMTSFALPYAHRVRRICYPPQLDPLTDDMILFEKRVSWPWNTFTVSIFICRFFLFFLLAFVGRWRRFFRGLQRGAFHGDRQDYDGKNVPALAVFGCILSRLL